MTVAPSFRQGMPEAAAVFEAGLLPLSEKQALCEMLLAEFGAEFVRHRQVKHELTHPCLVAPQLHHNQRSDPTASLNYEILGYKCLGCGGKGGLLWFIAEMRHCTVQEAGQWLAGEIGTGGNVLDLDKLLRFLEATFERKGAPVTIPAYSPKTLAPWDFIHPYLTDPKSEGGRGIPEANVIAMQLGYAEAYPIDSKGNTSERIVIPHWWKGELVGWQTRRLDVRDGTPKYLSSPDFPKDTTIYNYNPSLHHAIVVEAAFSVVSHVHAEPGLISTFGANITEAQLRLLAKYERVTFAMDNDDPGWRAVVGYDSEAIGRRPPVHNPGAAEKLANQVDVRVWENPYAADPQDMSTVDFTGLIREAVPFGIWTPPHELRCYRCKATAHEGRCS